MAVHQALEHHEHAEHVAEHGSKIAALTVAILAAMLALTEVRAKHAEIEVQGNWVSAADAWNQYQAKSIRQAVARDLQKFAAVQEPTSDAALADKRTALMKELEADQTRYEKDPKDGKVAIAERAREFEVARDEALHRAHSFDNAAAAFELGIVLATASAITASTLLIRIAWTLGVLGLIAAVLGLVAPEYGSLSF